MLRERGNQYLEHERSSKPPVLAFEHEMVLDGRTLAKPANYALVRIMPAADASAHQPEQASVRGHRSARRARPRASAAPRSTARSASRSKQGHPCYFVTFFPEPVPGQTIESVCAAKTAFLRKVNELHPQAEGRPFLIGNCQGGWALMMLAALVPTRLARSCWPARRCPTGRAWPARTRCATRAA